MFIIIAPYYGLIISTTLKHAPFQYGLAEWGHSGKGWFYGIKLHLTSNLKRKILAFSFSPGNTHGTKIFLKLNKDLDGIFVADAEFVSEDSLRCTPLSRQFLDKFKVEKLSLTGN
jgi:DDE family transposase